MTNPNPKTDLPQIHSGFSEFCSRYSELNEIIFMTGNSVKNLAENYVKSSGSHGVHTFIRPSVPGYCDRHITLDLHFTNQAEREKRFSQVFNSHFLHLLASGVELLLEFERVIKEYLGKERKEINVVLDAYPEITTHCYYPDQDGAGYEFMFSYFFFKFFRNKVFHTERPFRKTDFGKEVKDKFFSYLKKREPERYKESETIFRCCLDVHCKNTVIQTGEVLDFWVLNGSQDGLVGQAKDLFDIIGEIAFVWYYAICQHHGEELRLPPRPEEHRSRSTQFSN